MKAWFRIALLLFFTVPVFGSGFIDVTAERLASLITQTNCADPESLLKIRASSDLYVAKNNINCADKNIVGQNLSEFLKINDHVLYDNLVKIETENLNCSIDQWGHISDVKNISQAKQLVDTINLQLPKLDLLQKQINEFSAKNLNPGLIYLNDRSLTPAERQTKIAEVTENVRNELQFMQAQYEFEMAIIPLSKHGPVKSFVESKLSGAFGQIQKVNLTDFTKLAQKVKINLEDEKKDLLTQSRNNSLTSSQEQKLVSSQENIARLIQLRPEMANSAFSLQCRIDQRIKGKVGAEIGIAALSSVFTGGGALLARASRLAFVARDAGAVASTMSLSRVLAVTGFVMGTADSMAIVMNQCSKDLKALKSSCDTQLTEIKNDQRFINCLKAASFSTLPSTLWSAKKILDPKSNISQLYSRFKDSFNPTLKSIPDPENFNLKSNSSK